MRTNIDINVLIEKWMECSYILDGFFDGVDGRETFLNNLDQFKK